MAPEALRSELMEPLAPIALAALALVASFAVARRLGRSGATFWLDAGLVWIALIVVPAYALAWASAFTSVAVGLVSLATSSFTLAIATRARPKALRAALLDAARAIGRPVVLMREAIDRRAWVALGAVFAATIVWSWTALLAWLVPSSGWDGIWYHDTIVGFTIQNHGFATIALPREHQLVNGYPRLAETIAAYFVVLADDRFLDVAPTLTWPWVAVAFGALTSGLTRWWEGRVAAACAFVLVPALALQLRSSYVDVPTSLFTIAAVAYVVRRRAGGADLALAGLACGLLLASKATGLMQVAIIGAIALARVALARRRAMALGLAVGTLFIVAIGSPTYARNWHLHHNPVWPIAYEIESLDLSFAGPLEAPIRAPSFEKWLDDAYGPMQWDQYHHDVRPDGYGHALPLMIPVVLTTACIAWLWGGPERRRLAQGAPVGWIVLAGVGLALATPPLWWARFGVPVLACALALSVAWLGARPRIGGAVLALVLLVHLVTLANAHPGWHASLDDERTLVRHSATDRAAFPVGPVFGDERTLRAFERDVGPGDVVVWTSPNGFPSFAWNRHMSNRSVYSPTIAPAQLEALHARWVIVADRSGAARMLDRTPEFERVGHITDVLIGYRRK